MTCEEGVSIRFATFDAFAIWFRLWWGREPTAREVWLYLATRTSEAPAPTTQQQAEPSPYPASDYAVGQWWFKELEQLWNATTDSVVTHDMKRAAKVAMGAFKATQSGQRAGVAEGCEHDWDFHLESADGKEAVFTCHKCGAEKTSGACK